MQGSSVIKWLELVVSGQAVSQPAVASLRRVSCDDERQCYGLTVNERWLCSADGAVTYFDSIAAATRFLTLVDVRLGALDGEGVEPPIGNVQCFQLGSQGLGFCARCRRA